MSIALILYDSEDGRQRSFSFFLGSKISAPWSGAPEYSSVEEQQAYSILRHSSSQWPLLFKLATSS